MVNLDNTSEINGLSEGPSDLGRPAADGYADETLAEYLSRVGTSAVREVSVFAGVKKPRRPKPPFVFPNLPSLF